MYGDKVALTRSASASPTEGIAVPDRGLRPGGSGTGFPGAKGIYVGFEELQALYEQADHDQAAEYASRWTKEAEKVVEPTPQWLQKAGAVYLAMRS